MEFIDEGIEEYARLHTEPENDLLKELVRETHAMVLQPRMLSGHLQGRFLSFIAKVYQPSLILEIGTYTGYSALCMAEGLKAGGRLITIDVNEELETFTRSFFDRSPYKEQIDYRIADAAHEIPAIEGPIDMVFIDADKRNYALYFDLVIDKMRPGGLILVDNVLWSGKIIEEAAKDKSTQALRDFNTKVANDSRVEPLLLPIRDGLFLLRVI
ncbi:O-methyltransferase [Aquirufa antheringensis]|jgi:caffeoyl-CoA O-methyltransferase|uniref:O-methyltransferase n=1 Tax=Aquirufa antheringensis TaxID=2516559 RepID=A0A4Q9B9V1_9BACT|nr:O-methyltransferase [Aquirufa antheringensis]MCZ2485789.1 O-methyltransferase [Aquirufa antheringensis]MCZ2486519.1 O-methyltransferase [Aquirufa antheringensis]MCZ2488700.1 O-methyltransferase [Aquirufa antheringensis]TBH71228.1 O-methyltransferase [Aquirufa antheringensis]